VAPRASTATTKKWNTGTIDVYSRYGNRIEDIEADLNSVERDVKGTRTLNKERLKEKLRQETEHSKRLNKDHEDSHAR